jgi:hypothetical protein
MSNAYGLIEIATQTSQLNPEMLNALFDKFVSLWMFCAGIHKNVFDMVGPFARLAHLLDEVNKIGGCSAA